MIKVSSAVYESEEWREVKQIRDSKIEALLNKLEEGVELEFVEKIKISESQTLYRVTLADMDEAYLVDDDTLDLKEEEMIDFDEVLQNKFRSIIQRILDGISTECA